MIAIDRDLIRSVVDKSSYLSASSLDSDARSAVSDPVDVDSDFGEVDAAQQMSAPAHHHHNAADKGSTASAGGKKTSSASKKKKRRRRQRGPVGNQYVVEQSGSDSDLLAEPSFTFTTSALPGDRMHEMQTESTNKAEGVEAKGIGGKMSFLVAETDVGAKATKKSSQTSQPARVVRFNDHLSSSPTPSASADKGGVSSKSASATSSSSSTAHGSTNRFQKQRVLVPQNTPASLITSSLTQMAGPNGGLSFSKRKSRFSHTRLSFEPRETLKRGSSVGMSITATATKTKRSSGDNAAAGSDAPSASTKLQYRSVFDAIVESKAATGDAHNRQLSSLPPNVDLKPRGKPFMVFVVPGLPPIEVSIYTDRCTVEDFTELAVEQWEIEDREPALEGDPSEYTLHLLDDDDGTPDMDMPAFDAAVDISEMLGSMREVALVHAAHSQEGGEAKTRTRVKSSVVKMNKNEEGGESGECFKFLRLQYEAISTVSKVVGPQMTMREVLVLAQNWLAKAQPDHADKQKDYGPEKYLWFYGHDDESDGEVAMQDTDCIPMDCTVENLLLDSLTLRVKVPKAMQMGDTVNLNAGRTPLPSGRGRRVSVSDFLFSSIHQFREVCYYNVIKTNGRGKRQSRRLGIDRNTIYNLYEGKDVSTTNTNLVSLFKKGPTVAQRPIASVKDCMLLEDRQPRIMFRILFNEPSLNRFKKDQLVIACRDYEAESEELAAEVVAKIKWIKTNSLAEL
jgi:hypothetical protein